MELLLRKTHTGLGLEGGTDILSLGDTAAYPTYLITTPYTFRWRTGFEMSLNLKP